jgi:hypothetical protein
MQQQDELPVPAGDVVQPRAVAAAQIGVTLGAARRQRRRLLLAPPPRIVEPLCSCLGL